MLAFAPLRGSSSVSSRDLRNAIRATARACHGVPCGSGTLGADGRWLAYASGLVVALLLVLTLPASRRTSEKPAPVFAATAEIHLRLQDDPAGAIVAAHQPFSRTLELAAPAGVRVLPVSPDARSGCNLRIVLAPGGTGRVLFLKRSPPRQPRACGSGEPEGHRALPLAFPARALPWGDRPDLVDVIEIASPPGWFCGEGWAPDAGGAGRARDGGRPDATT